VNSEGVVYWAVFLVFLECQTLPVFFRGNSFCHTLLASIGVCAILINFTFHNGGRINLRASVDSSIYSLIEFHLNITWIHVYAYFEYIFITTLRMKGRLERILACTCVPYFRLTLLATLVLTVLDRPLLRQVRSLFSRAAYPIQRVFECRLAYWMIIASALYRA